MARLKRSLFATTGTTTRYESKTTSVSNEHSDWDQDLGDGMLSMYGEDVADPDCWVFEGRFEEKRKVRRSREEEEEV